MGDSVQDQLAKLFNLLLAEQQSNKELHAKFDALTQEWESTKKDFQTSSTGSPASLRRDKGISGTANSEKSGGSSFVPKFTKLDFPRYDGKDDPLGWLNRCKHFFQHQQTPEEEMVSLASYHLEGIAQLWYMQLLDDIPNPSWAEFSHQCNLRFGPPIRSNKLGELAKLKQMGSVADYQNQFEALVSRAGTLTQHQKVQLYLSGLQDSIAVEVELHHPTDLVNAMSISRLYERKLFPRSSAARDTRRAAIPPDNRANRIVRRLSPDEMEERRKKGLCFNCDEQFVRGHQCKKLFWIDLEETEDVEDFTADPEISLNAITGIRNPQSMRLIGSWMLGQVLILIDSGSTHSFVSAAKVEELNAVVNKQNGLKVHVANGEQLTSPGICKGIPVLLKSNSFMVDLFVLPLTNFDMVLGVNWLRTLGPILWDFTVMSMSFYQQGHLVTLQGIGAVLLHNRPVAYFSRSLAARHQNLPAYERELIGLVKALKHWHSYLWGREFIVRTDHYTLKYLLEQRHLSATQQHWISKLLGFSFTVEYRAGKSNVVADALSRRNADDSILMAVSMPQLSLFDEIRKEHSDSPAIQQQISAITNGTVASKWVFRDGLLFYNNRVYLPPNSPSIQLVVSALHNQSHEGYQKTLYRITRDFYWQGMKNFVRDFVRSCDWIDWLSWAEYCYNTSYHTSLKSTPFETVYGRPPPRLLSYLHGSSSIEAVDTVLRQRDDMLHLLRQNLLQAQNKMKALMISPTARWNLKFYGPFRVLECIGTMAYKLDLPAESKIHPVFHVSYLKPYHAGQPVTPTLPPTILLEDPVHPLAVLDHRIKGGIPEVLIHWSHSSPADASWERVQHITDKFPDFKPADKLPLGREVMLPNPCKYIPVIPMILNPSHQ
ncbi:hypothetical protein GH714_021883 [Hevea brasiliensis]|uniref:Reverse transcriptase RNase H-like domain-containing protein n=1 Tax=Hevea brasiliensis TaxID=3981 RepID=A0A6A6L9Y8_HEVBR|nr:hypothetical protein GH714_021883 [Hevea brasiliensis]